ncbi:MAG TPA: TIR domain-containing protein [Gammaproteobacteria bacterium]
MSSLRRLGIYLGVFFLALTGIVFLTDAWRQVDYFVYAQVYMDPAEELRLNQDLYLIDVEHPWTLDRTLPRDRAIGIWRMRLVELLQRVREEVAAGNAPDAVVLDIYFANVSAARDDLYAAVEALTNEGIPVLAVFNTLNLAGEVFEDRESEHLRDLYALFFGGYLHTNLNTGAGFVTYPSEISLPTRGGSIQYVEALPLRLARALNDEIEPVEGRTYVLPLGPEQAVDERTWTFRFEPGAESGGVLVAPGGEEDSALFMDDRILIIGNTAEDTPEGLPVAGPKALAWAIDDQLAGNVNARLPVESPLFVIGEVVFFSLFAVLVYALLFKYARPVQKRPYLLAVIAATLSLGLLLGALGLFVFLGWVIPVGLPAVGIAVAAILAARFAYLYLVTGVPEGTGKYDVFVSYSRADGKWVEENLYGPLKALRKPDGSELSVFFDKDEIALGEPFTPKYMWAIVDTKYFIPVFTKNYYGPKSHGRNEMDLAYKRAVEKRLTMLPITHSLDAVPEIYTHINFIDVSEQPDFFPAIRDCVLEKA